jgi:hypothetical protein
LLAAERAFLRGPPYSPGIKKSQESGKKDFDAFPVTRFGEFLNYFDYHDYQKECQNQKRRSENASL